MAEIRVPLTLEDKFSENQDKYISGMEKAAQATVKAQNAVDRMSRAAQKKSSLEAESSRLEVEMNKLLQKADEYRRLKEQLDAMGDMSGDRSLEIADNYNRMKAQAEEMRNAAQQVAAAYTGIQQQIQQTEAEYEAANAEYKKAMNDKVIAEKEAAAAVKQAAKEKAATEKQAAEEAKRAAAEKSKAERAAAREGVRAAKERQKAEKQAAAEAEKNFKKLTDQMNKLSKANPGKSLVRQFTRVAATLFSVQKILSFLRNSMEAMPEESKAPWDNLKKSVSQFFQSGISYLLKGMIPGMEKLNQVMNSPTGQKFAAVFRELAQEAGKAIGEIMSGIAWLVSQLENDFQEMRSKTDILIQGFRLVGNAIQWVKSNWSMLVPVIQAVATVILVFKGAAMLAAAAQAVLNGAMQMNPWVLFVSLMVAATQASGPLRTAILLVAAAVGVLNLILNGNPIMLIITAIGWLVMKIYDWVQAVGGLQIAWKIAVDWILTAWDALKLGWETGVAWVQNLVDQLCLIWSIAATAVANAVGDMKVWALTQLQNLINGAIGLINNFIELLNKIPGVNIQAIGEMTFATEAAAENEAAKQAREADLTAKRAEIAANRSAREQKLTNMANDAAANHMQRQGEIAAMQAAQKIGAAAQAGIKAVEGAAQDSSFMNQYGSSAVNDIGSSVGGSLGSDVSAIKKEVSLSEEELQSLVDMAQRQYVNQINLTAQTPIINIKGQNTGDTAQDRQALADVLRDILIEQSSAGTYRSTARVY